MGFSKNLKKENEKQVIDIKKQEQEKIEREEQEKSEEEKMEQEKSEQETVNIISRFKKGLGETKNNLIGGIENILKTFKIVDEDLFEELEETLIMADLGVHTSLKIIEQLRKRVKKEKVKEVKEVKGLIIEIISEMLQKDSEKLEIKPPTIILVIGVNGVGKTTSIGKLAYKYKEEGFSVMLGAGDTFRAAAIEQLQIWADRVDVPLIKHKENADASAVVFDAVRSAKAKKTDILIIDTAGRLHNKKNLMEELKKINKVIVREYEKANLEVFLVLDSTTGQNAVEQAKQFKEVANITGLMLTKLDGTAKGGITIAIKEELNIPVRYVGLGEKLGDLEEFDSDVFSKALFE